MKQFKYLLITLLFVGFGLKANAQRGDRYERIKSMRVAFITDKLSLSTEEAEKFWPIYNEYDDRKRKLRNDLYKSMSINGKRSRDYFTNLSDADANVLLDKYIDLEAKQAIARREMMTKLRKVIPAKKILQLKRAEDDFSKELLNQLRKKRKNNKE